MIESPTVRKQREDSEDLQRRALPILCALLASGKYIEMIHSVGNQQKPHFMLNTKTGRVLACVHAIHIAESFKFDCDDEFVDET